MAATVIRDPGEMQARMIALKREGRTICVVPTMGALHAGHRALIADGRKRAEILVVTIFVNPTQFGPQEDLDRYPRTFEADLEICGQEGADYVFAPEKGDIYPGEYSTFVEVRGLSEALCGLSRPGHFRGVCTICAKLFLLTQADIAVFGWKDAQQLLIIRRMAQDLNIPIEIIGLETVREEDGLALSSRNRYLSPEARAEAPVLYRALEAARKRFLENGEKDTAVVRLRIATRIEKESHAHIDYVEVVCMDKMQPIREIEAGNTLIAVAAWWGGTRLIDNIRL